jgi:hypothetical protein
MSAVDKVEPEQPENEALNLQPELCHSQRGLIPTQQF